MMGRKEEVRGNLGWWKNEIVIKKALKTKYSVKAVINTIERSTINKTKLYLH